MADIASGDVTYTLLQQRRLGSRNCNVVRLAFGNGSLTVPANGIPLLKGKMGCPVVVESLVVVDQGTSGYRFQYDQSTEKLVVMQAPAQTHTHDLKVIGSGTIVSDGNLGLNASAGLVKVEALSATIAGTSAASAGGVMSATLAAAAMSEASTVAIAAQTIEVEVIGW